MKRAELLALKVVAAEIGISRTSLWRAARSSIEDFPAPVRIRGRVYWKRSELDQLETALMSYRGRCVFEHNRDALRRLAALKGSPPVRPARRGRVQQGDLFHPSTELGGGKSASRTPSSQVT